MTLNDQIIDEAEQLVINRILPPGAPEWEVVSTVSDIVGVYLHSNSIGARLAVAAYNRYAVLQETSRV